MDRNEFKDRLAVQLIPMFTNMMATKVSKASAVVQLSTPAPGEDSGKITQLPDPQQVTAHAYAFAEQSAMVRDEHYKVMRKAKGQGGMASSTGRAGKPSPQMSVARSSAGGNGKNKEEDPS